MWYSQYSRDQLLLKDNTKKLLARVNEMTLIDIPCWWNGSQEDLISTIKFYRPDINISNDNNGTPITCNPHPKFFPLFVIPDVGELMLASFPHYKFTTNINKWWMGEKYDGVRCCWNPITNTIYSRYGAKMKELNTFVPALPSLFVDGELWFGREQYNNGIMLKDNNVCDWSYLRLVSFDNPSLEYQKQPYELRFKHLLQQISPNNPFTMTVVRILVTNSNQVNKYVQSIIDSKGEGVILQKHSSIYDQGRSLNVVKLKVAQEDQEGLVISVLQNNTVLVRRPNDTVLSFSFDNISTTIPTIGDIVTFSLSPSFNSNSNSQLDTRPKINRIRKDLSWEEVLYSYFRDRKSLNKQSNVRSIIPATIEYWTTARMRNFMENFSRSRNMDPLLPSSWIHCYSSFISSKIGKAIVEKYDNKFTTAIHQLFPEVKIDLELQTHISEYWNTIENRKKEFIDYAKLYHFDPHVPNNWYHQPVDQIINYKNMKNLLPYYNDSVTKALLDLFPDIGFNSVKLFRKGYWDKLVNRRNFFVSYAKSKTFDALVPDNWYSQPRHSIRLMKNADRILSFHNKSVAKALMDLFPNIGLQKHKFLPQTKWAVKENRKKFFERYANTMGFDAYNHENWYRQPKSKMRNIKGMASVVEYYNGSIVSALLDLFPNIGLDQNRFSHQRKLKF